MEFLLCFLVWWAIGATAFAWSMEWDIKGTRKILMCMIGLAGPLCIAEAISIRNKFK